MRRAAIRLLLINTVAFVVVIGLGVAYLAFAVYQVKPGQKTTTVSLQLANTNMTLGGTGVFINGLRVGKVTSVSPNAQGALLTLKYPRSERIPRNSQVTIGQQSALGEPYVDFQPQTDAGPYLAEGDTVPTQSVGQTESIPQIFSTIKGLSNVIAAGPMAGLLKTLAQAFDGNTGSLDNVIAGSQQAAGLLQSRSAQLEKMFRDTQRYTPQLGPVIDGLPTLSAGLGQLLDGVRRASDAVSPLVKGQTYEQLSQTIDPFIARLNPYLRDILPNVFDAVGPLLPIATALNETLPQINASKLLTQLLNVVGSDGAARLTLTIPPR